VGLLLSFLPIALIVFALVDLIRSNDDEVRYLPKMGWVLVIVFLPVIGSLVWLIIGKDRSRATENVSFGDPRRHEPLAAASIDSMTAEEELAAIEREIEFHENEARIRRLEAQLQAKRQQKG